MSADDCSADTGRSSHHAIEELADRLADRAARHDLIEAERMAADRHPGGVHAVGRRPRDDVVDSAAKILAELKVGGPALTQRAFEEKGWGRPFFDRCKERNLPLDFFSFHAYVAEPGAIADLVRTTRKELDARGFK